jgi:iron complex outermembrane receptor protein
VDASFSEPSWLLSIDKSLSDETLIYASHRHGYRSGGFNLRATSNRDIGPFQPEIVDDIEFGFKNTVSLSDDWSLRSNLAAYYQWYKDIQRNVTALTDGQLNNSIRNAASANVYGAEAEFELRHGRDLSFSLNYAFVKPSYDSYPLLATVNGVAAQPADYSDRDFTYIPRHQLNFNVRYARDLNGGSQLVLVGGVYYQSEVFFSEEFQTRAQLLNALSPAARALAPADLKFGEDGYTLVNLRAELNNIGGSNVGVAIYGRNVLDESYIQGGSIFYTSLGIDTAVYGDPRTYGIELTYDF